MSYCVYMAILSGKGGYFLAWGGGENWTSEGSSMLHLMNKEGRGKGEERITGEDPYASKALLDTDAILHYASRGRLDDAPVRGDAG